ncbi:LysR family transcriptional regulator [Caulobacter sp. S45]|uniref:LysR family transcriptional regulator n=1 Tax=Caulobacter sp. S45 TaxID=1641861 RepID=UPI00131E90F0|nr:LysR family transcriptional regulator [Caulobacter sp. S45]
MEMHQIRYFLAVSETLNLTKAAERCNVAQPSLTRAIKALEAELGGELICRERSLSHLTELGQRVLPMLRQCYETAVAAKSVAVSMRNAEVVPLSLALSHTIGLKPFEPMLQELSGIFPGLQLKLHRGSRNEVAEYLKSGTAELAIAGPLGEAWPRLDAFPLFELPCEVGFGPEHLLATKDRVSFGDLISETLVIDTSCELTEEFRARLKANGVSESAAHYVTRREDQLTLLKANLGVAIVTVAGAEMHGLSHVPLKQLDLRLTVSAYTVAGRQRGNASVTLLNMLRAANWT